MRRRDRNIAVLALIGIAALFVAAWLLFPGSVVAIAISTAGGLCILASPRMLRALRHRRRFKRLENGSHYIN